MELLVSHRPNLFLFIIINIAIEIFKNPKLLNYFTIPNPQEFLRRICFSFLTFVP